MRLGHTLHDPESDALLDFEATVVRREQRVFRFHRTSYRDLCLARLLTQKTFSHAWAQKKTLQGDLSPSLWMMKFALDVVPETFGRETPKPST